MTDEYLLVGGQYIIFTLGHVEYGVSINKIREILGPDGIVGSDLKDPCIQGVINIRNEKIQILDLSCRFGLTKNSEQTGCAVLVTTMGSPSVMLGLMVDSIRQVLHIKTTVLEKILMAQEDPRGEFIVGQVRAEGRVIFILDLDKGGELVPLLGEV